MENKSEKLRKENWEGQKPVFSEQSNDSSVQILPDNSVSRGKFRPHPDILGVYYAHPSTIRAMKKDIWVAGEDSDFFSQTIVCQSCQKPIDQQYWKFCPFCESSLPKG